MQTETLEVQVGAFPYKFKVVDITLFVQFAGFP